MVANKLWAVGLLDSPRTNELMIQSFNEVAIASTEAYALLDEVAIKEALGAAQRDRVSTRLSEPYELRSVEEVMQLYAVHKDLIQTVEQYGVALPNKHWVPRGEVHGVTSAVLRRRNEDGSSDTGTVVRRDSTADWLVFEDPSEQKLRSYQEAFYPTIVGVIRNALAENDDKSIIQLAKSPMMQLDWSSSLNRASGKVLHEFFNAVWSISGEYYPWFEACDRLLVKRPAGYDEALRNYYGQKVPRITELNITEFHKWALYTADGRLERR